MDEQAKCGCNCHAEAGMPEGLKLRLSLYGADGKVVVTEETVRSCSTVADVSGGHFRGAKAEVLNVSSR